MSTLNEREAALRRALHAAADAFEPGSDGLQRIQSRLGRPRPIAVAWADAAWLELRLWATAGALVETRAPGRGLLQRQTGKFCVSQHLLGLLPDREGRAVGNRPSGA